jgi:hypothetical protein
MIHLAAAVWDPIKLEVSSPKDTPSILSTLVGYAWPLVTIAALIIYRKSIGEFLRTSSTRATEIGFGSWASIKLPEVNQASQVPPNTIRALDSQFWFESSGQWFKEFLSSSGTSEYALLNLGDGDQWITSRLYIFAVMLQRMKALKCIVFTRDLPSGKIKFLGCATPDSVRWALAFNQPWLETAFVQAYSAQVGMNPPLGAPQIPLLRADGSIEPSNAEMIVSSYIRSLIDPPTSASHFSKPEEWVDIKTGWEHASWVNEDNLRRLITRNLWEDAIEARTDDSPEQKKLEVKRVVSKSAPYVATLSNGSYNSLVSRLALAAEIAQAIA